MKFHIFLIFSFCTFVAQCQPNNRRQSTVSPGKSDTGYTKINATRDGIGKVYYGREIAHVMGAAGADWLERQEREKEEGTVKAIAKLPITNSSVVADIGAGTGYYSFRIAKKLPAGKVYAIELQDELISYLRKEISTQRINNVEVVKGSEVSPNLPVNTVDVALMVDVYHELEYPAEMLQAIYSALKPTGKLVLLEYRGEDPTVPIKELHKMTIAQVDKELMGNGFKRSYKGDFLPIQHFLVYEKAGVK